MATIPDDLFIVRYDDVPGAHVAGTRGSLVHLCSAARSESGETRHLGPIFELDDPTAPPVDCAHCRELLKSAEAQ